MDRIEYSYASGVVGTWNKDLFRLDGFTDEAAAIDWWTLDPDGTEDVTTKEGWFKQLPQGLTRFAFTVISGDASARVLLSNTLEDVVWFIRDPGDSPLPDGFSGKLYDWTGNHEAVEGAFRFAMVAVKNNAGVTTALLSVSSLSDAPRPPSTWKLAPVGYYAPIHIG